MAGDRDTPLGWVGVGRMGRALVERLLRAGHDVRIYNRTREKAEPLRELGAEVVDSPADLATCAIVFTMVAGSNDVDEIVTGESGLLSRPDAKLYELLFPSSGQRRRTKNAHSNDGDSRMKVELDN